MSQKARQTPVDDNAPHLLVVDDDTRIRTLLSQYLVEQSFRVTVAATAAEARRKLESLDFDLLILDVMMPGETGVELTKSLRKTKDVPILMLTALSETDRRIQGLEAGADDYIAKPFSTKELLARVRAVLRRRTPEQAGEALTIGSLALDPATHRVSFQEKPLKLGPTEFKLLHYLMGHAERVHSRAQLLDKVWGDHVFIEERTVDVHVKRLREAMAGAGVMVETVRGAGYRLTASPALVAVMEKAVT